MLQSGTEFADTCATWIGDHKSYIYEPQGITIAIMNCRYLHYTTHTRIVAQSHLAGSSLQVANPNGTLSFTETNPQVGGSSRKPSMQSDATAAVQLQKL